MIDLQWFRRHTPSDFLLEHVLSAGNITLSRCPCHRRAGPVHGAAAGEAGRGRAAGRHVSAGPAPGAAARAAGVVAGGTPAAARRRLQCVLSEFGSQIRPCHPACCAQDPPPSTACVLSLTSDRRGCLANFSSSVVRSLRDEVHRCRSQATTASIHWGWHCRKCQSSAAFAALIR